MGLVPIGKGTGCGSSTGPSGSIGSPSRSEMAAFGMSSTQPFTASSQAVTGSRRDRPAATSMDTVSLLGSLSGFPPLGYDVYSRLCAILRGV